ncbi:MAG: flavin-containing monooxygenase [Hyphomicrobiaceae bacterium]
MQTVAIIGAGPAGLAAARWLKRDGFEPMLFEQGDRLGGQWAADPRYSGVWPSMHTNTCREMTQFSDLAHAPGTPVYPSHRTMLAYLERYADQFGLVQRIKLRTRVVGLSQSIGSGWALTTIDEDCAERAQNFDKVIIASGRFNKPMLPEIPGLASFAGPCEVAHASQYKDPDRYRGRRVLVAGCAVSALEIACDLAMTGAAHVATTNRRQRYIMQKIVAGIPIKHLIQTRSAALAQETLPKHEATEELRRLILRTSGSPEMFGASKPDENLAAAGVTQCQHYLPLVAEGRIDVKPWITAIDGQTVHFSDGSEDQFDGLIFGTGFELNLPFLSDTLRQRLGAGTPHLDLYKCTFHPELPGLALAGMFQVTGPYFPPIELQARWIAYAWSGARLLPSPTDMQRSMAKTAGQASDKQHMPSLTVDFAREAGVEPDIDQWPELEEALLHGPLLPASFRLNGRDPLIEAPRRLLEVTRATRPDATRSTPHHNVWSDEPQSDATAHSPMT